MSIGRGSPEWHRHVAVSPQRERDRSDVRRRVEHEVRREDDREDVDPAQSDLAAVTRSVSKMISLSEDDQALDEDDIDIRPTSPLTEHERDRRDRRDDRAGGRDETRNEDGNLHANEPRSRTRRS
jgi:hypothetical protein